MTILPRCRASVLAIAGLCLVLGACGLMPEPIDETKGWSAQKLYTEAKDELESASYQKAIKLYEKLEARYPYGQYAQQAQIEIAYAYYKDKESASAIAAADRQDLSERDPKAAREAFDTFKELSLRFPNSKYTPDAVLRMNYLINALAANEVHVARYYMKRGAYLAAANRAQTSLKTYPQAPANEEGLVIMVQAYDALGMPDLRNDAERVLMKNFPDSKYIAGAQQSKGKWWQLWNE